MNAMWCDVMWCDVMWHVVMRYDMSWRYNSLTRSMRLSRAMNFSSRTVPPSTTVKRGFIVKKAEGGVEVEVELEAAKDDENILAKWWDAGDWQQSLFSVFLWLVSFNCSKQFGASSLLIICAKTSVWSRLAAQGMSCMTPAQSRHSCISLETTRFPAHLSLSDSAWRPWSLILSHVKPAYNNERRKMRKKIRLGRRQNRESKER